MAKRSYDVSNKERRPITYKILYSEQCNYETLHEAKSKRLFYHFQNKHPQQEIAQCLRCTKLCVYPKNIMYKARNEIFKEEMHVFIARLYCEIPA